MLAVEADSAVNGLLRGESDVPGSKGAQVPFHINRFNRGAVVEVPTCLKEMGKAKGIEYGSDPAANPYLAPPAILMAGLYCIKNKVYPGSPAVAENMGIWAQRGERR